MSKKKLTIDTAIALVQELYARDKDAQYIEKPIAHSLYTAWKAVDALETERSVESAQQCIETVVLRCQDCKYFNRNYCRYFGMIDVKEDGYCSSGVPREQCDAEDKDND